MPQPPESRSGVFGAFPQLCRQVKVQGVSPAQLKPPLGAPCSTATVSLACLRREEGATLPCATPGEGQSRARRQLSPLSGVSLPASRRWWSPLPDRRCRPLTTSPRPGSWWSSCGSRLGWSGSRWALVRQRGGVIGEGGRWKATSSPGSRSWGVLVLGRWRQPGKEDAAGKAAPQRAPRGPMVGEGLRGPPKRESIFQHRGLHA